MSDDNAVELAAHITSAAAGTATEDNEEQKLAEAQANDAGLEVATSAEESPPTMEMIVELPHDILTGYILCHLTGRWKELSRVSQGCILLGVIASYLIQFMVVFALAGDISASGLRDVGSVDGTDPLFNLVALAVLLQYLVKDLLNFYYSVWFWLGEVEKEMGVKTLSRLNIKSIKNVANVGDGLKNLKSTEISVDGMLESAKFWQFRLSLIFAFSLYILFGLYAIVAIGGESELVDKIEVALNIFFVLEIDDWACELFLLTPGVLDNDQFDQTVRIKETEEDSNKRVERRLLGATLLLILSFAVIYIACNWPSIASAFA